MRLKILAKGKGIQVEDTSKRQGYTTVITMPKTDYSSLEGTGVISITFARKKETMHNQWNYETSYVSLYKIT